MDESDFIWLSKWYKSHCTDDYKNDGIIHVGTLDNPGWALDINLENTELERKKFPALLVNRSENNWLHCKIVNNKFIGDCGPLNFSEIIYIFRHWAELYQNENDHLTTKYKAIQNDDDFKWLQHWYLSQCDGDWEHIFAIIIDTIGTNGWHIEISLNETIYENVPFISINEFKGKNDWYKCEIIKKEFIANCDPLKLNLMIKIFREWAENCQKKII